MTASWWQGRTVALALLAGLLVVAGFSYRQSRRIGELGAEMDRLLAERRKLRSDFALGRPAPAREGNVELVRLRRSEDELLRLRREVVQLRSQLQAALPPTPPSEPIPPAMATADPHDPGKFIATGELRFAGYSTPVAAMESIVWCMVAGDYDVFLTALSPADRAEELNRPEGRDFFQARQQQLAPQFKAMQVSAMKVLSDDEVELKVLLDFGTPLFQIQPLIRTNEQWRLADSTREFTADWDSTGDIQQFPTGR